MTKNDDFAAQISQAGPHHDAVRVDSAENGDYKDPVEDVRKGMTSPNPASRTTVNPFGNTK